MIERIQANGYTLAKYVRPDGSVYWHGADMEITSIAAGWRVQVRGEDLAVHARLTLQEAARLATWEKRGQDKRFAVDDYAAEVYDLDACDVDCRGTVAQCKTREHAKAIAEEYNRIDKAGIAARTCEDCGGAHYGRCLMCEPPK